MKQKKILSYILALSLSLGACGHSGHEGHDHEHEGYDHASEMAEGHDHDHEGHDHDGDEHEHEGDEHDGHGHAAHDSEIPLADKEAARLGVKTAKVGRGPFAETLRVGGVVERATDGEIVVSASRSGRFSSNASLQIGNHISAGQSLGSISSAGTEGGDVVAAGRARLQAAEREVERLKPLVATGAVSRAEFQRAEAELSLARAEAGSGVSGTVTSPGAGVVTNVAVRNGEFVERGQTIAVISKNTKLTLRADVPARHAAMGRQAVSANFRQEGMGAAVSLNSHGGRRLDNSAAAASEGYIPVRFSFVNDGTAIPGAFAEIWLIGSQRPDVLTVPEKAIVEIQGVKYVFEKVHEGKYAKHRVRTGGSDGVSVEVIEGLSGGEEIVTDGARVIRMAEISNIAPPAHTHNH